MRLVNDERILTRCISDDMVTQYAGSASFGPAGAEINRKSDYRSMGAGWLLYGFVRTIRPRNILEIGCGGSSLAMLWALKHNALFPSEPKGHFWGVDPFEWGDISTRDSEVRTSSYWEFADNVKELGFQDICTFYHMKSQDIDMRLIPDDIDMLVVDGDHGAAAVKQDFEKFMPLLVPGGYAFFHDLMAIPQGIGDMVESKCTEDSEFRMLVEPDHLSYSIIQRKFSLDYEVLKDTWRVAGLPEEEMNVSPIHLTNARGIGACKNWKGKYFPEREEKN